MAKISDKKLMFVDDPIDLFKTLCKHQKNNITKKSFTNVYKKIKGKENKKIGSKTPDTHVGTLHYYNLIEQNPAYPTGTYKITSTGKKLCKLLGQRKKNKTEFQRYLATLILSHPQKSKVFNKFLKFIRKKRTIIEIRKEFEWATGLTLIAWSIEAGLAWESGGLIIKSIEKEHSRNEVPMDEFWKKIKKLYERIRKTKEGRKNLFVDFHDLRLHCSYDLSLENPQTFDKLFKKLMNSKYKHLVNLHGAPTGEFDKKANFEYKGKLYPYLSLVR